MIAIVASLAIIATIAIVVIIAIIYLYIYIYIYIHNNCSYNSYNSYRSYRWCAWTSPRAPLSAVRYTCVCVRVCVCVCVYYMYVYMYIYIYTHTCIYMYMCPARVRRRIELRAPRRPLLRPIPLLTNIVDFRGVWLEHNLNSKGWNSQAHREVPGKFESSNVSRENVSRGIGRKGRPPFNSVRRV